MTFIRNLHMKTDNFFTSLDKLFMLFMVLLLVLNPTNTRDLTALKR